ncbi:MAG TPA: fibronectin type III domain-containing protein [Abditibacteriaceae bacterium]|jgi:fibronectin type 3 domain-containing protein
MVGLGTPAAYAQTNPQVPQGGTNTFAAIGTLAPTTGPSDIRNPSGTVVATFTSPGGGTNNGWTLSTTANVVTPGGPQGPPVYGPPIYTVTAPVGATIGTGYQVRSTAWQYPAGSAVFDVVAGSSGGGGTVPAAPTGLTATSGNAQVSLSWTASAGATSYTVKRGTAPGGPYNTTFTNITTTSYTNTGLTNGTAYYYVVTATNAAGESPNSNQASATPQQGAPSPPASLTATSGNAQVSLSWTASAGATSYTVKRGTAPGGPYNTTFTNITTTSYTNTGLTNSTNYWYVVTASNSSGESGNSNEVNAYPQAAPAAPTDLTATAGDAQIALSWTASAGAGNYIVKRSTTAGGGYSTVGMTTATSYTDAGLTNGTTYYYVVTATITNQGYPPQSGNSNEASNTPRLPAPFPKQLTAVSGNTQVALSWEASPGATSYNIKRSTVQNGPYTTVGTSTTASYTNTGLSNGTTYHYVVSALNVNVESSNSDYATATPLVPGPTPQVFQNNVNTFTATGTEPTSPGTYPGSYNSAEIVDPFGNVVVAFDTGQFTGGTKDGWTYSVTANALSYNPINYGPPIYTVTAPPSAAPGVGYKVRTRAWQYPPGTALFNIMESPLAVTWSAGGAISCGGIRYPASGITVAAGSKKRLDAYLATDWDKKDLTFNSGTAYANTITYTHSDPCSYTWSANGGQVEGGNNVGQSIVWIAPATPGTYTITLAVDDQNTVNKSPNESGLRNDAIVGYNDQPVKFSITVNVQP